MTPQKSSLTSKMIKTCFHSLQGFGGETEAGPSLWQTRQEPVGKGNSFF